MSASTEHLNTRFRRWRGRVAILLCTLTFAPLAVRTRVAQADTQPADGVNAYETHCATCHGHDGRARTLKGRFKGATDLTAPEWQAAVTDASIEDAISAGRNNGRMPAFAEALEPGEIKALVSFVRTLRAASTAP